MTAVKMIEVKQDRLIGISKDNQCSFHWTGFNSQDMAKTIDMKSLLAAVKTTTDFVEKESGGIWEAKHNLVLPYMWKYMAKWNFGFTYANGYFTLPSFTILSDRDTQPMVSMGRLEALLKFLTNS